MLVKMDDIEDHHSVSALKRLSYSWSEWREISKVLLHIDRTYHWNHSPCNLLGDLCTNLDTVAICKAVVHSGLAALAYNACSSIHIVLGDETVIETCHIDVKHLCVT